MNAKEKVKLTQFSHGAGCGCKIAPDVLEKVLAASGDASHFPNLIVGNLSKDDAACVSLGDGRALISTTDFFMPIVDDPYDFGRVAATNSISDIYAMGGTPCLAISILGWPIDKLPAEVAREVIKGAQDVCTSVEIPLAGGHSIDSPEPIFGLAVSGLVDLKNLKQNSTAMPGDLLFLTKPLGVGILTSAEKHGLLRAQDSGKATKIMTTLNKVGEKLGRLKGVHAMTDVTGFGLLGHALEMAQGSGLKAKINLSDVPILPEVSFYLDKECCPGGTFRNVRSYGKHVSGLTDENQKILADPQTSGGLLVAVSADAIEEYCSIARSAGIEENLLKPLGKLLPGEGIELC
ncbi:MAG: selenide, water dikinase SelD [Pseudomonadota bacterium]